VKVGTALGIALRLAKAGWWGGDPGRILEAPMDEVMAVAQYDQFLNDYESTVIEINKGGR